MGPQGEILFLYITNASGDIGPFSLLLQSAHKLWKTKIGTLELKSKQMHKHIQTQFFTHYCQQETINTLHSPLIIYTQISNCYFNYSVNISCQSLWTIFSCFWNYQAEKYKKIKFTDIKALTFQKQCNIVKKTFCEHSFILTYFLKVFKLYEVFL